MANSTEKPKPRKPKAAKASDDKFPLYLHKSGHYAKKVRGRVVYFGKDQDAALARWKEEKDDLLAGRTIRLKDAAGANVAEACNAKLKDIQSLVDTGEQSPRTFSGYLVASKMMTKFFGRKRALIDLRPVELSEFRNFVAKGRSLVSLGNILRCVRGILKHAHDYDLIDRPLKYAKPLKLPSAEAVRGERQDRGPRVFTAEEVRWMLNGRTMLVKKQEVKVPGAGPALRAMILLGLNCGFGNTDCARLSFRHLDLDAGWHNMPRKKTTNERRCALWPETVEALRAAIAVRKPPKDERLAERVFITKYRDAYVKTVQKSDGRAVTTDSIGLVFRATPPPERPCCRVCRRR